MNLHLGSPSTPATRHWLGGRLPLGLAGLLLLPAWHLKHPLLFAWRHAETPLLLGLPLLAWLFRRHLLR